ncbi:hypothetical protein L1987_66733 [Smallanthus sonchifolius]|uniref:Uncharacterized protein n=1 Tax=Smallanthus sonchifolius TaxID=185202 RepID=A0ACB9BY43_9ASTR|nr:hypothetical protein L1987_66733 [Smallanthus sonchifolius]
MPPYSDHPTHTLLSKTGLQILVVTAKFRSERAKDSLDSNEIFSNSFMMRGMGKVQIRPFSLIPPGSSQSHCVKRPSYLFQLMKYWTWNDSIEGLCQPQGPVLLCPMACTVHFSCEKYEFDPFVGKINYVAVNKKQSTRSLLLASPSFNAKLFPKLRSPSPTTNIFCEKLYNSVHLSSSFSYHEATYRRMLRKKIEDVCLGNNIVIELYNSKKNEELKGTELYNSSQEILVVGDGDLSFGISLALKLGDESNLVVKSKETYD